MPPDSAAQVAEQSRLAHMLADLFSVGLITNAGTPEAVQGSELKWIDVRPLLSSHEQPSRRVDLHVQALEYLRHRRLLQAHPTHPHLVRVISR